MSKPNAPPPPDYKGAAEATAAADLEMARMQTLANRPDEFTPYGSRTWQQGSGETFDEAGYQSALDAYQRGLTTPTESSYRGGAYIGNLNPRMITTKSQAPAVAPTREAFTTVSDPDKWTATTALTPEAQRGFEATQRMQTGLAELGEQGVSQMGDIFSTPFSVSGEVPQYQGPAGDIPQYQGPEGAMPTYGAHRQGVTNAMMSRINDQRARDEESKRSALVSQGIPVGSEAYSREMDRLDRQQTDARQQAEIAAEQMAGMGYSSALQGRGMQNQEALNAYNAAMGGRRLGSQESMADYTTGMDTRRQGIQEALLARQTPINEMSAFRTGSQVGMPQFQAYGQQQFTGGPDYAGAAQRQGAYDMAGYNADVAQQNAMYGGLAGLGAAGITAFSDKRLKKNIERIGTSIMGFPVYAFDYIWGGDRQIGVMAQDVVKVMPDAISTVDGYMAVDYGMIK